MPDSGILRVYTAKGARVFVSGLLSILIPVYLHSLGYPASFVFLALVAISAGNAVSNVAVTYFQRSFGTKRFLLLFGSLTAASGLLLAWSQAPALILLACLIGNVSTTGTEAGPFQSIEAGVLPELTRAKEPVKAFGTYNLIGYAASAAGAYSAGAPSAVPGGLEVYRAIFLGYALVGVLLVFLYSSLRGIESERVRTAGLGNMGKESRKEVARLSGLFSVDAFGGSFVATYVLSYWFLIVYGLDSAGLAEIFTVTNVIVAISAYAAVPIARRLGNLRTMVYTHLVSNVFLLGIPLAGSLVGSLTFLFLRQSLSQMDVPTRQALMTEMFPKDERVPAYAVTNTARTVATFAGSPVITVMFTAGLLSGPILSGGISKIAYDIAVYLTYRRRFR